MKKTITTIIGLALSSTLFAQAPKTEPIIILPGNTMENMPVTRAVTSPGTYAEVSLLIEDAALTASKIESMNKQIEDVSRRGEALATRMRIHNAQWPNGCVYPQDQPHFCDGWVQEGNQLNAEMQPLKTEYQTLKSARGNLLSHQAVTLARLKFNSFFEKYTSWEKLVVGCAQMQSDEAAHACLKQAWDKHP